MTPKDLKKIAKSLGLTGSGMARELGVHRQTWEKWVSETGSPATQRKPSAASITAIRLVVEKHGKTVEGILNAE